MKSKITRVDFIVTFAVLIVLMVTNIVKFRFEKKVDILKSIINLNFILIIVLLHFFLFFLLKFKKEKKMIFQLVTLLLISNYLFFINYFILLIKDKLKVLNFINSVVILFAYSCLTPTIFIGLIKFLPKFRSIDFKEKVFMSILIFILIAFLISMTFIIIEKWSKIL